LGKGFTEIFHDYSSTILTMNFMLLGLLAIIMFIVAFPTTWHMVFIIFFLLLFAKLIRSIVQLEKKPSIPGFNNLIKELKLKKWELIDLTFAIILVCGLLGINFIPDNPYPSIFFIVSCLDILIHFLVKLKWKN